MNQTEKIKSLEREIELLKQIIELKDKLLAAPSTIHYYPSYPNYPSINPFPNPYNPSWPLYPTITCGQAVCGNGIGTVTGSASNSLNS